MYSHYTKESIRVRPDCPEIDMTLTVKGSVALSHHNRAPITTSFVAQFLHNRSSVDALID
jgi:hypothetical protein